MSVLIRGMEMPKDGDVLTVKKGDDGKIYIKKSHIWGYSAELIELPPHGRLIDADALMREIERAERTMEEHGREYSFSFMSSGQEISTEWYYVEHLIFDATTIIPEEGET